MGEDKNENDQQPQRLTIAYLPKQQVKASCEQKHIQRHEYFFSHNAIHRVHQQFQYNCRKPIGVRLIDNIVKAGVETNIIIAPQVMKYTCIFRMAGTIARQKTSRHPNLHQA